VWPGTTVPRLGVILAAQTASGLIVPASAVAGPAPIDAMSTYLTSTEVLGRPLTDAELDKWLKAATDEHLIMEAAIWLARLEHHGSLDVDFQLEAASNMFGEPVRAKVQNLIRNGARLLAPQVLLGVIKAALLVSPAGAPARADNKGPNPFVFAMLGVADRLGIQGDGDGGLWGSYPADLSLEVARNQHFNADHNFGSLLARYQRLWHDLPSEFAGEPDAIDIEGVFEQITGVTLDDLLLVGVPATGAAERGRVRFERNYFYDNIPLPKAKLDAVLRLLATDKVTMRTLVRQESQASGFDWSYTTFRQFPTLQTDHGDLILLSPVFLQERLTGGAAYWTLHDHFLSQGTAAADRFRTFHGRVVEANARECVSRMVPELPGGARRVWYEEDMQQVWSPKRGKVSVCDIAIDYGWAWVCIEVVSGRLTQQSLAGGTADDFDQDVAKLVEKKVKQLDATIRHLDRDEEKLTGWPRTPGRRIFPVVLVAHGFPVNPITMAEIHERVGRAGLLQGGHLGRLEIIDLDELEQVEALHESGGASLARLLADKQTANLFRTALNQYLYFERRIPLTRPDHQGRLGREVIEGIAARYEFLSRNPRGRAVGA
jgi:hypothetical protein